MAVFKCKCCGASLPIKENVTVVECEYCYTAQTLPRLSDDKRVNLYDRANHFRRNNDYDKAMSIYEQILNEDRTDAEAYWSIVLCKYGIEYVEDTATKKRVPTVNRTQLTSIFADEDYKSAIENADVFQRKVYEAEAKSIDEIQKGILAVSSKEKPFDVFICYKESDSTGRRTKDSVLAQELYYGLKNEGFNVFFARITLEDKLGTEYEPYIFGALNSAKVMVVLGTQAEYFNAVWVKNEWKRYLALIKNGAKKTLIPAYKDMDPYDLPDDFSHLQAQDMSKLGFMQDLIRGIKKIISADEGKTAVIKETTVIAGESTNMEPLLKRAHLFLEDAEFDSANEYAERVLDIDPECAEAYLVKTLVDCRLTSEKGFSTYKERIADNANFKKALRFADSKYKDTLLEYQKGNENYFEEQKKETIYQNAIGRTRNAPDDIAYKKSIAELESIIDYKDSREQIELIKKSLEGWYRYKAEKEEKARQYAEQQRIEREKAKRKQEKTRKRLAIVAVACCLVTVAIISGIAISNAIDYKQAQKYMSQQQYDEAMELFEDLGDYKDAENWYLRAKYMKNGEYRQIVEMDRLASFTIPDGVTSIGDFAFSNCSRLTSIEIPDSVTSIGDWAFNNCSRLTSIEIPDSVTSIGSYAFSGCDSLTYNVHGNVNYLGNKNNPYVAAMEVTNTNFSTFTLHENTKVIADDAFNGCSRMTSIEIPDSVTSIGDSAFRACSSLTSVVIGDSVTSIGDSAFRAGNSLTSIEIPDSVTSIGWMAFSNCSSLTSIEIPDSVTSIGGYAFADCSSLTSITFNGTKAQWNALSKGSAWSYNCPAKEVVCSDGKVAL